MVEARFKDGTLTLLSAEPLVHRKRRWKVTRSFDAQSGRQTLTIAPSKRCRFSVVAALIDQAMTGPVTNIEWKATGR